LAKAGYAHMRRGLIRLAWRFLPFQKNSALAQWYSARTEATQGARKTTMIIALARKLHTAMWGIVTAGVIPGGVRMRPIAA
jgi:transposase